MGSFTFYILAVAVVLSSMVPHAYATTKLSRKIQSSPDDAKKKEEELRTRVAYTKSYKSKKSKKAKSKVIQYLEAEVEDAGSVVVKFEDGHMVAISYELDGEDMPDECKDCYFAIHKKRKCSSPGDEMWYSSNGWSSSKWDEEAHFTTSFGGKAAGTFFDIDSGYYYGDNKCRALVIYDDGDKIGCAKLKPEGGSC